MKKILAAPLILIALFSYDTRSVEAGAAGGGASEVTQLINMGELIPINISDAATAIATQAQTFFTTIMGPIANALIANMLQNTTQNIISWANGGFSGDGPQLIQNPEDFIKKAANNEARKALAAIPSTGGLSDSLFATINNSVRDQNKAIGTKLKELSVSSIPGCVQRTICTEAGLTSLSRERATDSNGAVDEATALVEKEYLYGYACSCSPNDDTDCASKLMDLYEQRPSLGGSCAWNAITSGDNSFTKATIANSLVAEEVAKAKKLAENELFLGLGAVSETKCLDLQKDAAGNTYCNRSVVVNPGKAVQSAIELAFNSGTLRLTNIQGEGVLNQILGSLTEKLFTKGLNAGLAALGGGDNSSETVSSFTPPANDLSADPERKASTVSAISQHFTLMKGILDNLETTDREYEEAIRIYEDEVTQVKDCFDSLVDRGITSAGDSRSVRAYTYYNDGMGKINAVEGVINEDLVKIAAARDLIQNTEATITAAQSSEVISTTFGAYRETYKSRGFPDNNTYSERRIKFTKDKTDAERDTEDTTHLDNCSQIESDYWRSLNAY